MIVVKNSKTKFLYEADKKKRISPVYQNTDYLSLSFK